MTPRGRNCTVGMVAGKGRNADGTAPHWGNIVAYQWVDCDRQVIRQRYDRIAALIPFFDYLLFQPPSLRKKGVERLSLRAGERVLEIGCGTGRNFPYMREAVGPTGKIYGVDLSSGMLRLAQELCAQNQWSNVELAEQDAAEYVAPEPLDAVLFGFSYNTMPHHLTVLHHAWQQLRPGGRLVILDARLPPGLIGKLVLPFSVWLMKRTMLGNPYIRPWEDLARLTDQFDMQQFLFGSYHISRGIKS